MSEFICIISGPNKWAEWENTLEQNPHWNPRSLVWTDCCSRNEEAHRTQIRESIEPESSWYDPTVKFRCKIGMGCNKNPGYLRTAHLRNDWDWDEVPLV